MHIFIIIYIKYQVTQLMTNSNNNDEREFEEGAPGTQKNRKNDPLTEYSDKEAMTPAKIKDHEPTAVSRDSNDQTITSTGQTGTDSEEALEEYRRKGMAKVGDDNTTSEQQQGTTVNDKASQITNTLEEGAESTFDKLKAGAKAIGKKVSDPDTSLGEEYNKEKTE
jgi:hypothetical protein